MLYSNVRINNKSSRGVIAVEVALLLPILIVLALSIAEFGRAIYQYNTLTKSVRDAARFISQYDPDNPTSYGDKVDEAKQLAVYGMGNMSKVPLVPGLSVDKVKVIPSDLNSVPRMVTVKIEGFQFNLIFNPLVIFGASDGNGTIAFDPIHVTMRQL